MPADWKIDGSVTEEAKDQAANIMGLILKFITDLITLETTSSIASLQGPLKK